ncbi:hypothetical protein [Indioceanicola profundi]|uniref:hypothetical protein n=1 Tax=Indioceanicola profundi TaxID=2220096 RepID=UPI0013C4DDF4|nr:hypothetical protein [Indioceanicola profundi]
MVLEDSTTDKSQQIDIIMEEFKALRNEILFRASTQLNIIKLNITAMGLIAGAYFTKTDLFYNRILFLIPVISPILGLLWLDNATSITNIGNFIQKDIKSDIKHILGKEIPDFESYVRELEFKRLDRSFLIGIPVLTLFALLPLIALLVPILTTQFEETKTTILALCAPGVIFLLIFSFYWIRFVWVRIPSDKQTL